MAYHPTSHRLFVDTRRSRQPWATKQSTRPRQSKRIARSSPGGGRLARAKNTAPPTDEEWDAFLSHFEKRKVSVGTCARAFGTPCVHEHACVRCSLLRPDPAQRARLDEIRNNLEARIMEAKREGWLGEVEGLQISYSGVKDKLAQIDTTLHRRATATELGMPSFASTAGRAPTTTTQEN